MDIILPIFLIILALALFCAEVVFPSFGILTIAGLISSGVGIFFAFSIDTFYGWCTLILGIIGMPIAFYLGLRWLKASPMVLSSTVGEPHPEEPPLRHHETIKIGEPGIAITDIRPMGTATFGNDRVEVASAGEIISAGQTVAVVEIDGQRIIVRALIEP